VTTFPSRKPKFVEIDKELRTWSFDNWRNRYRNRSNCTSLKTIFPVLLTTVRQVQSQQRWLILTHLFGFLWRSVENVGLRGNRNGEAAKIGIRIGLPLKSNVYFRFSCYLRRWLMLSKCADVGVKNAGRADRWVTVSCTRQHAALTRSP